MSTLTPSHDHFHTPHSPIKPGFDLLAPLRRWVDRIEVNNAKFAHLICRLIPCQCAFERDIQFFGRKLFHVPALCKLNPLYDEFIGLRFRALSYLTDVCGEDVTKYIC
jgi:Mo-dependent nitrogenase C-terminus